MAKVKLKKRIPSVGYAGSLIQQGFGESLSKGYLLWSIDKQNVSYVRRFIQNDHGWYKMTISRGENVEERIDNLQFSSNKRKTKIHIVYEDYEESYSIERLKQIERMVKDKFGCEHVHVEFSELEKSVLTPDEVLKEDMDPDDIEQMFNLFLDENEFDLDGEEDRKAVIDFALKVEREIGIKPSMQGNRRYSLVETEISNVFSFPIEPTTIKWGSLKGITGIFGENYCGKSNLLKAVVWGLHQQIMGGAHQRYLVNIYTDSDKGYVKNIIDIDGVLYRILREVHKGKSSNSYPTKFEVYREAQNSDGIMEHRWCSTLSDNSTADNTEVKRMITEALGTYDDFMKVSMHAQNENDGYLNLEQQEKNDLIARYLNLQSYRDRFEYIKKPYNELRAKQKLLGEAVDIELEVKGVAQQITEKEKNNSALEEERRMWAQKQEDAQEKVLLLTRKLHKIEETGYDSKEEIQADIVSSERSLSTLVSELDNLDRWLETNIMKELEVDPKRTTEILEAELAEVRKTFTSEKTQYINLNEWLSKNPKKEVPNIDVHAFASKIEEFNRNVHDYKNKRTIFLGKNCPTCKQSVEKPDPKGVQEMDSLIQKAELNIAAHKASLENYQSAVAWNTNIDNKKNTLNALELTLRSRSSTINAIKTEIENFNKNKEFIELNRIIERKRAEAKSLKTTIEEKQKVISKLKEKEARYDAIASAKVENLAIEKDIDLLQGMIRSYKASIHSQQTQITALTSDIHVLKNSLQSMNKKLEEVKSGDRTYKLYSIYLQAVERSGIPAMVIKQKLPMINNKVNSILQTMVGFKMDFSIDMKGNITELFYNTESKWDSLPLNSGSGAQKFIVSIAIKDALNYISKRSIVQPSIIMIDEGFGTLDEELRENIMIMLEYLKSKYQNVVIITHLNEVKEGADHIIEAVRDRSVITKEEHEKDNKAGVSRLYVRR